MIGYCVKCRKKEEMKDTSKDKIKGRHVVRGICAACGTKMVIFVK